MKVEDYILFSKEKRQEHLKLSEACIERGGNSLVFRGLLAHILNTTIPKGSKIQLCHACHNGACGNPWHLYWGTAAENCADDRANRGISGPRANCLAVYGADNTKKIFAKCGVQKGNTLGTANSGVEKSHSHRENISDSITKWHEYRSNAGLKTGRYSIIDPAQLLDLVHDLGWEAAAKKLNITISALRGRYYRAKTST